MNDAFGRPQSVVVLGGTSEIAGALVDALVSHRCRTVVLAGRNPDALADAGARARRSGATKVDVVTFDATDTKKAEATVARCFSAAGDTVDLVLVTVGLLRRSPADATDPERLVESIAVNFAWPAAAMAAATRRLRSQGYGRVIVLSSVAATDRPRGRWTGLRQGSATPSRGQGWWCRSSDRGSSTPR
jgi:decaprenylphospho-beta-D-erythro-pentofuranosid-2-ulose 2-reductase